MLKRVLLGVALLLATVLQAQPSGNALDRFAGAPCGITVAAFKELHPEADCDEFNLIKGDEHTQCVVAGAVGLSGDDRGRTPVVAAMFYDGKLEEGTVEFVGVSYPTARDVLIEKYGKPSSTRIEKMGNAFGAIFDREVLNWKGPKAVATLQQWQQQVDDAPRLWVYSSAALQRSSKRRAEEKAKAKEKF